MKIYLIIKFGATKNCKLDRKIRTGLKNGHCSLDLIVLVEPTMETKEIGEPGEQTLLLFLKQKSVKTQDTRQVLEKYMRGKQFKSKEARAWKVKAEFMAENKSGYRQRMSAGVFIKS